MTIPIAELVDISASLQARFAALFETLGGWVSSTDDPKVQQRFAQAAHRHAWHAELWADRRPAVPLTAAPPEQLGARPGDTTSSERLAWYLDQISGLRSTLIGLSERVDAPLDPSTARVVSLIIADLTAELG